jgi:hypothetical protein
MGDNTRRSWSPETLAAFSPSRLPFLSQLATKVQCAPLPVGRQAKAPASDGLRPMR